MAEKKDKSLQEGGVTCSRHYIAYEVAGCKGRQGAARGVKKDKCQDGRKKDKSLQEG